MLKGLKFSQHFVIHFKKLTKCGLQDTGNLSVTRQLVGWEMKICLVGY